MTRYFYGRVSTDAQNLASQEHEARQAKIPERHWYTEKQSGLNANRPVLQRLLERLEKGDVLVVTRLDRLARNLKDLLQILDDLERKEVGLVCLLQPHIDTTNATGRLVVRLLASIAEFEAEIAKERQREGIERAKNEGKYRGGVSKFKEEHRIAIYDAHIRRGRTATELARAYECSPRTIRRIFQEMREQYENKDN